MVRAVLVGFLGRQSGRPHPDDRRGYRDKDAAAKVCFHIFAPLSRMCIRHLPAAPIDRNISARWKTKFKTRSGRDASSRSVNFAI